VILHVRSPFPEGSLEMHRDGLGDD
jgi:hypothetical protein